MFHQYLVKKKYLTFILLAVLILSLVTGCSNSDAIANDNPKQQSEQHQEI